MWTHTIVNAHRCSHNTYEQIHTCTILLSPLLYYKTDIARLTSHHPGLLPSPVPLRLRIHSKHHLQTHPEADCHLQPVSEGAELGKQLVSGNLDTHQGQLDAVVSCHVPGEPPRPRVWDLLWYCRLLTLTRVLSKAQPLCWLSA